MRAGSVGLILLALAGCAKQPPAKEPDMSMGKHPMTPMKPQTPAFEPAEAQQLVLVTTTGWDATTGTLRRFEKSGAKWNPVGAKVDVNVGRAGLAFGRGLAPIETPGAAPGPMKREGDGKAPAGVFAFGTAFGDADREFKIGYMKTRDSLQCVDDPESNHYARLSDVNQVGVYDWKSGEKMKQDVYALGVLVGHNTNPVVKGAGSCIFLHIWKGPGVPTAGCTAMERAKLDEIITWLDPAKKPVLVQLPADQLTVMKSWGLPEVSTAD